MIKEKAFAKINLALNILNKRSDNYHEIETILQSIDLCDEILLNKADNLSLSLQNNRILDADKKNLAYRAAYILKKKLHINFGAKIILVKNIPIEAGLGGVVPMQLLFYEA